MSFFVGRPPPLADRRDGRSRLTGPFTGWRRTHSMWTRSRKVPPPLCARAVCRQTWRGATGLTDRPACAGTNSPGRRWSARSPRRPTTSPGARPQPCCRRLRRAHLTSAAPAGRRPLRPLWLRAPNVGRPSALPLACATTRAPSPSSAWRAASSFRRSWALSGSESTSRARTGARCTRPSPSWTTSSGMDLSGSSTTRATTSTRSGR